MLIPRKRSAQRDACEENRSKNVSKPALIIEPKKDKDAKTGIDQIKERCYPQKVAEYTGDILLVGINYDTDTKQHTCKIERWTL